MFSEKGDRGMFYPYEIKLSAFATRKESTIFVSKNYTLMQICQCVSIRVCEYLYMYVHVYVWIWVCVLVFACPCPCPCQVVRSNSICLYLSTSRPIYGFVCMCLCVCVAYNLCLWECCAFVFVCFLPVATCKDRFCIFFCLGLCLFVSLYVRFHRCFFLVNKVEHSNRSHRTFWDHFWCSTQPSGGTTTDEYLLHHHWVFHYHSWYLFQTIIPDLRKIL